MSEWIDISLPITPYSVVWPGAPKTEITLRRSMARGDKSNNSNLFMNCHTGTHVDAPLHFLPDGLPVDRIPLGKMVGPAFLVDLSQHEEIIVAALEKEWPKEEVRRVLVKTWNSKLWKEGPSEFLSNYCALAEPEARWLLAKGIDLVGIDHLSIQRFQDSPIVHQILLQANVVILEGLDLSAVTGGHYELICLPLNLMGVEGSPARAVLRKL